MMNILYLDSKYLSFDFALINQDHSVESIENFQSLAQASDYFAGDLGFDLILYNPYIFIHLIESFDFNPEGFFFTKGINGIPYANPQDILPLSRTIEKKLIGLFPPETEYGRFDVGSSYKDKCVLVTGAGGSIGSELVIQLLENGVELCLCLDLSEFSVFNLKQKLSMLNFDNFKMIVGSYGDTKLLEAMFAEYSVDTIINASAYKHVSIMQENAYAAFNNNILNFINFLKIAAKFGVPDIIQVSTDKAAEPSNIMGFSKLLCEQILIHANKYLGSSFNYSIVRFGNVVGSSGSVVPIFIDNIKKRQKLSVTHVDVDRFMMQISDAVSLILRAASHRKNETYILDMGAPYKILDLGVRMLKNSHFHYDENLIEVTGLQCGEKLTEILFTPNESSALTKHDGVFVISNRDDELLSEYEIQMLCQGNIDFLFKKIETILK